MSNPTSTSPKRKYQISPRLRQAVKAGQWPPEGHPWRELALLPNPDLEAFFQGPIWAALKVGLSQLRERAVDKALHDRDASVRDESRGVANTVDDILHLQEAMRSVHAAYLAVADEEKLNDMAVQSSRQ